MADQVKILCPVDFSEHSNRAFARACETALHAKAKLYILHVDSVNVAALPGSSGYVADLDEYRRLLEEAQPANDAIDYEQHFATGDVPTEIVRFATLRQVNQIVMGTHGRTGLLRSFMGSVASTVTRLASCEVETVRPATVRAAAEAESENANGESP